MILDSSTIEQPTPRIEHIPNQPSQGIEVYIPAPLELIRVEEINIINVDENIMNIVYNLEI